MHAYQISIFGPAIKAPSIAGDNILITAQIPIKELYPNQYLPSIYIWWFESYDIYFSY